MRKYKTFLFLFPVVFFIQKPAFSQTDRELIVAKLHVYYAPNPNTSNLMYRRLPDSIISSRNLFGPSASANMDSMQSFLRVLFRPVSQGGSSRLQQYVASILRINNKIVVFQVVNDINAAITSAAETNWGLCGSGSAANRYVWPCASHFQDNNGRDNRDTAGTISIGERYFRMTGVLASRATFLHELMHTQDASDRREHIWFSRRHSRSFSYGNDEVHYFEELIPNVTATYQEGIANAFSFLYYATERNEAMSWFAENGECLIETNRPSHISASIWLYSILTSLNPPLRGRTPPRSHYGADISNRYKVFRIAELPAKHILHNERIIGLIAAMYAQTIGYSKFISAIRHTNTTVEGVSTSPFAQLINSFCTEALPSGLSLSDVARSSRSQMPYLFPLALVDYFSYYRSNSQSEFRALFENLIPADWVDLYWVGAKDMVRRAAPFVMNNGVPNGTQNISQHITAIKTALGM